MYGENLSIIGSTYYINKKFWKELICLLSLQHRLVASESVFHALYNR
jgi:hypothetical protein